MLITLNQHDLCKLVAEDFQEKLDGKFEVEVGIQNNKLVAIIASGESLPTDLYDVATLVSKVKTDEPGVTGEGFNKQIEIPEADPVNEEVPEEEEEEEDDPTPQAEGSAPKKRKRRTKAEIEADKLAEQQAQAESLDEAPEAVPAQEVAAVAEENNPFAGLDTPATSTGVAFNELAAENELDDKPPFDIDEGANLRAEAELLPDAKEEEAQEPDSSDPFADMGLSSEGDELFAQPNVEVTEVTKQTEGFVEPVIESNDPFASFN